MSPIFKLPYFDTVSNPTLYSFSTLISSKFLFFCSYFSFSINCILFLHLSFTTQFSVICFQPAMFWEPFLKIAIYHLIAKSSEHFPMCSLQASLVHANLFYMLSVDNTIFSQLYSSVCDHLCSFSFFKY